MVSGSNAVFSSLSAFCQLLISSDSGSRVLSLLDSESPALSFLKQ